MKGYKENGTRKFNVGVKLFPEKDNEIKKNDTK